MTLLSVNFPDQIKVDSWWRWVFWHCSYCLCKCDDPSSNSDRYWSLKPVLADVASNKVITGARLVKKDRVVHIEIEEATALPEGWSCSILSLIVPRLSEYQWSKPWLL